MKWVALMVSVVLGAAMLAGCGGGSGSSSSSTKPIVDGTHPPGHIYESSIGDLALERAEVGAYAHERFERHAGELVVGNCESFPTEASPGYSLLDCAYGPEGGEPDQGSFYAVDQESGKIYELGLRLDPNPEGPYEYEHPLPGEE
jgi:hypothetical protein